MSTRAPCTRSSVSVTAPGSMSMMKCTGCTAARTSSGSASAMAGGTPIKVLTPGSFDVTEPDSPFGAEYIQAIDSTRGFIYYLASPDNATQVYLYRSRLDGPGKPERVTPAGQ